MKKAISFFQFLLARKSLFCVNYALYNCALRGMGIMNYETSKLTGERWFLHECLPKYLPKQGRHTFFGVGANEGDFLCSATDAFDVPALRLDTFIKQQSLARIDLLKIDTEGNEKFVLQGLESYLKQKSVSVIQLEFNALHVYSKTFVQVFRLLPKALLPLKPHKILQNEIFGFQNIIAISDEVY